MVVIISTTGPTYNEMMQMHQQKLNNLEALGRPQTDNEVAMQIANLPEQRRMKIHGIYPTIYNYGNNPIYTTIVCFEPIEEEEEKEEAGEGYVPSVRVS